MWSLGCILGEVLLGLFVLNVCFQAILTLFITLFSLLGKPLFPGTSTLSQVSLISVELPVPTREGMILMNTLLVLWSVQCDIFVRCGQLKCHVCTASVTAKTKVRYEQWYHHL